MLVLAGGVLLAFALVQDAKPGWWERLWYPLRYEEIVRGHARNYELDPALLAAVIYQESKFKPNARSSSGAIGLMQLLPNTAKGIAVHTGGTQFRVDDLYNPEINVRYGAWYLRHLLQKYGDERTALAAYNAGQDNVDRWRRSGSGIQFSETRAYVDRVEELKKIYRDAYGDRLGEWLSTHGSPTRFSIRNCCTPSDQLPRMSLTCTRSS
jgi:soluble lytic murein transglycosylase